MPRGWLRHTRSRDLFLIFAGLFGLIVIISIAYTKYTHDKEQEKLSQQQALREQRLQEERRKALEEQKRQAALREKQLQEERARARREEAARQAREAEVRRRREQLERLRQLGVRSVPVHAVQTDPFQHLGVWFEVRSEPEGADVYFDWTHKGKTPLWLSGTEIAGFLVLAKEGHEAWFRDIAHAESGKLTARLDANTPHPRTRLLLTLPEDTPTTAFPVLRSRLADAGFLIPGEGAAQEFRRTERAAGGLANGGFRAWARTKFGTNVLLRANLREHSRDIGAQSSVLAGTVRVFVDLDFDVYDLTTGEQLTLIAAAASAFALDQTQGFQKAFETATADAAAQLQQRLSR